MNKLKVVISDCHIGSHVIDYFDVLVSYQRDIPLCLNSLECRDFNRFLLFNKKVLVVGE